MRNQSVYRQSLEQNSQRDLMTSNKLSIRGLAGLFGIVLMLIGGTAAHAQQRLHMVVGEVKVLSTGAVDRVAVGNGGMISTSILKNGQMIVLGEKAGTTDLHIWREDGAELRYRVTVTPEDTGQQYTDLRQLLGGIPGVSVRRVGDTTVLEGQVAPEYQAVIDAIAKQYSGVLNLTRVTAMSTEGRMVYMDVKITEFNTNRLDNLGINWSNPIAGPQAGLSVFSTRSGSGGFVYPGSPFEGPLETTDLTAVTRPLGYFGIATEITSRLNFLVNSGDALVLAQPRLSARSGGKAEFLAGGEVPLPITNADGQTTVEFKKFGILLNIAPTADAFGNVQAAIETEVSTIDNSIAVNGIPGFRTRNAKADVSLKAGQTLVISGLVNREMSKDVNRLAGLSDLPILGALFRSNTFRNNKSELVIFVTPHIYDADSELNRAALARSQEMAREFLENSEMDLILD